MAEPAVKLESLTKSFAQERLSLLTPRKRLHAVKNVSVDISRGESFGIIGESGCGNQPSPVCWSAFTSPTAAAFDWVDGMPRRCLRRSETE